MVKTKNVKQVPMLRFPGFDGEWKRARLGSNVIKVGSGSTPRGGAAVYQNEGVLFIRSQNVNGDSLLLEDVTFISQDIHEQMKNSEVHASDILLNITGASIGRSCVVPDDFKTGNVNQHVCIIRLKNCSSPKFYQAFLSSAKGQKLVYQGQAGGGREGLNFQSIRLFKIFAPTLPEQEKIASFLSAVDKKIQQLTAKKELLEQYKKGVMQRIFSQEIRFTDENGKDYPDWQKKKLGELILKYRLGGNYNNSGIKSDYPLIKMGNLGRGNVNLKKIEYIIEGEQVDPKDEIVNGDLFFNTRNTLELVGKVAIWRGELQKAYYNSNLMLLTFVNNLFMNYRLNSYEGIKGLRRFAIGTTSVAAIYTRDLLILKLCVPCIKEQKRIGDFLENIDHRISLINTQLTQTQTFKKGLLQQMFV